MLPGLTRLTLKSKAPAAASAAPTRWNDIRPPFPHERGSPSVASTAWANGRPSTPIPSSTSTMKRWRGPVPYTAEVPSTTERVPAPCST
jgi:hypothetical protein